MTTVNRNARPKRLFSTQPRFRIKLANILIASGSLIGCIVQISYISGKYFQYKTVTQLTIARPVVVYVPAVSVCTPYPSLLNVSQLHQHETFYSAYQRDYLSKNKTEFKVDLTAHTLTISDVFKLTPSPEQFMKAGCHVDFHDTDNSYLKQSIDNDCALVFDVIKYYKEKFMCYTLRFKPSHNTRGYKYSHISNAFTLSKGFYLLEFPDNQFDNVTLFLFVITSAHQLPRGTSDTFNYMARHVNSDKAKIQSYAFNYGRLVTTLLPPPYETNCHDYTRENYESQAHCYDACFTNSTVKKLNKLPFTALIENPYNIHHLGKQDIKDKVVKDRIIQLEDACEQLCSRPDCEEETFISKIVAEQRVSNNIRLILVIPNEPDIIAVAEPLLTAVDFITYILSCISFWFGFSPLQLISLWSRRDTRGSCMCGSDCAALRKVHALKKQLRQANMIS